MKDSALRRLFEILGQEGNYTFSKGYARNLDSLAALYEKLSASLRGEQLRDFKKLCECFDESNAGESEMFFKLGFRFAVKLMAECMTD